MDHLLEQIDAVIRTLARDYRNAPGLILTEDDLQCLLVSRLLQVPELAAPVRTADGVVGSMIHSEVSWFDENGLLRIKPDITILDPRELSLFRSLRDGYQLPNKGFSFGGNAIILELKFVRWPQGVTDSDVAAVQEDVDQVVRLFRRLESEDAGESLYGFVVVFSKVARRVPAFDLLIANDRPHPRCRVIYETAGVVWPDDVV